jgi:hypothetical protein
MLPRPFSTGDQHERQFHPQQGERSVCISDQSLSPIADDAKCLPVWLEVLGNHHSWFNNPSLLGKVCLCEGLYMISNLVIFGASKKLTVESLLSPIFLPTNFWVHSSVFEFSFSPELIPGTTRGILRIVFVLKGLYGSGSGCLCWILVLLRKEFMLFLIRSITCSINIQLGCLLIPEANYVTLPLV